MADFYGYNPREYIQDFSWIGDIGQALGGAAQKMPELLKFNKLLYEDRTAKEKINQSMKQMIDNLNDSDLVQIASFMDLPPLADGQVRDVAAIKNQMKAKYNEVAGSLETIKGVAGEEETTQVYAKKIIEGFGVPLAQAMSKTPTGQARIMATVMQKLGNADVNKLVTDNDLTKRAQALSDYAAKQTIDKDTNVAQQKEITQNEVERGDLYGEQAGTTLTGLTPSEQFNAQAEETRAEVARRESRERAQRKLEAESIVGVENQKRVLSKSMETFEKQIAALEAKLISEDKTKKKKELAKLIESKKLELDGWKSVYDDVNTAGRVVGDVTERQKGYVDKSKMEKLLLSYEAGDYKSLILNKNHERKKFEEDAARLGYKVQWGGKDGNEPKIPGLSDSVSQQSSRPAPTGTPSSNVMVRPQGSHQSGGAPTKPVITFEDRKRAIDSATKDQLTRLISIYGDKKTADEARLYAIAKARLNTLTSKGGANGR
jgi:hypothetical protein